MKRPVSVGALNEVTSRRWCSEGSDQSALVLLARCRIQPTTITSSLFAARRSRKMPRRWSPCLISSEPDGKKGSRGVVVVASCKKCQDCGVFIKGIAQRWSWSLSIPVGRAHHERDAPGRENKRVKSSQQGDGMCNFIKSFAYTITSCTQRYVASRPERRIIDLVLLIHMRLMSYPGVSSLALFCPPPCTYRPAVFGVCGDHFRRFFGRC